MENVIKIFREIQSTSGKNDKQAIIARNQDDMLFKDCLVFLLDNNIITGISKAKINKNVSDITNKNLNNFGDIMEYLKENNTGRDIDISTIQSFINIQPKEHQVEFLFMR